MADAPQTTPCRFRAEVHHGGEGGGIFCYWSSLEEADGWINTWAEASGARITDENGREYLAVLAPAEERKRNNLRRLKHEAKWRAAHV